MKRKEDVELTVEQGRLVKRIGDLIVKQDKAEDVLFAIDNSLANECFAAYRADLSQIGLVRALIATHSAFKGKTETNVKSQVCKSWPTTVKGAGGRRKKSIKTLSESVLKRIKREQNGKTNDIIRYLAWERGLIELDDATIAKFEKDPK